MASRNNLIEQMKTVVRKASQVFAAGGFVQAGPSGVVPLLPGNSVVGLGLEEITTQTPDYASAVDMYIDGIDKTIDRFLVSISGTATKAMEQRIFDITGTDGLVISVAPVTLGYASLAVSTFAAGELVKQTSGAGAGTIGIVVTDNGSNSMTLQALEVVGDGFSVSGALLGLTGGATAVVATAPVTPTQFKLERFISASLGEFSVVNTQ